MYPQARIQLQNGDLNPVPWVPRDDISFNMVHSITGPFSISRADCSLRRVRDVEKVTVIPERCKKGSCIRNILSYFIWIPRRSIFYRVYKMAIKDNGENKDNLFWKKKKIIYFLGGIDHQERGAFSFCLLYQMGNLFNILHLHKIYNAVRHFKCPLHLVHDYKIVCRREEVLCVFYLHFPKSNFEATKWIMHRAWCLMTSYRTFYFNYSLGARICHKRVSSHLRSRLLPTIKQESKLRGVAAHYTRALAILCHVERTTSPICRLPLIFTREVN